MQPKSIILFFYGYILFFRRQLIGGNVNIKNIDQLPNIFEQCMWMLFVVALLLFIAKKPIYKILNEKNKQLSN
ncbi:hypothetical protein CDJ65_07130 [Campylobacter jejuni]|nr:hypothetical protein [Campylobacter jejuni]